MAVAEGMSPKSFPQSSSGRFDVIMVERVSYRRSTISNRYSPDRLGSCLMVAPSAGAWIETLGELPHMNVETGEGAV